MDEVRYERALARALLRDQHPDLAELELREVSGGWDNQLWRLGEELAVRLPRTERAPALLRMEQTWLPMLAGRLPLPTPVPVRIGRPSGLFGHPWTIARWVDGEPADRVPVTRIEAAEVLAGFLRALHRRAPAGMLAGVIDFGDLCSGDPATDLSAAWILLPAGAANRFFDAYEQADEATITRARGWAVLRALNLIHIGRNGRLGLPGGKPTWEPAGRATLERVRTAANP